MNMVGRYGGKKRHNTSDVRLLAKFHDELFILVTSQRLRWMRFYGSIRDVNSS